MKTAGKASVPVCVWRWQARSLYQSVYGEGRQALCTSVCMEMAGEVWRRQASPLYQSVYGEGKASVAVCVWRSRQGLSMFMEKQARPQCVYGEGIMTGAAWSVQSEVVRTMH